MIFFQTFTPFHSIYFFISVRSAKPLLTSFLASFPVPGREKVFMYLEKNLDMQKGELPVSSVLKRVPATSILKVVTSRFVFVEFFYIKYFKHQLLWSRFEICLFPITSIFGPSGAPNLLIYNLPRFFNASYLSGQ